MKTEREILAKIAALELHDEAMAIHSDDLEICSDVDACSREDHFFVNDGEPLYQDHLVAVLKWVLKTVLHRAECPVCGNVLCLTSDGHPTLLSARCFSCQYSGEYRGLLTPELYRKFALCDADLVMVKDYPETIDFIYKRNVSFLLNEIADGRCTDPVECAKIALESYRHIMEYSAGMPECLKASQSEN